MEAPNIYPQETSALTRLAGRLPPGPGPAAIVLVVAVTFASSALACLAGLGWPAAAGFAFFASALSAFGLRRRIGAGSAPTARSAAALSIALATALIGAALAWKVAPVFGAPAMAATGFLVVGVLTGTERPMQRLAPLGLLLFAFPWVDPQTTLAGFLWRSTLAQAAAKLAGPLVGAVSVQGTTLSAESVNLALSSDAGGFRQIQMFLLAAVGLGLGSAWGTFRWCFWMMLAAALALASCLFFTAVFFVVCVLADGALPAWAGPAIEGAIWLVALGILAWVARPRKPAVPEVSGHSGGQPGRIEAMFPDDVANGPGAAGSATAK